MCADMFWRTLRARARVFECVSNEADDDDVDDDDGDCDDNDDDAVIWPGIKAAQ